MKRIFSVFVLCILCFQIFIGNIINAKAAVIEASSLFLANAAVTYAEASGLSAAVSGMSAAEVGAAFSSSAVSAYAASVGTSEAALASTVAAGAVISPKTIVLTAAAAAVLVGIISYVISQNTELEEVDVPVVLTSNSYFLDSLGNKWFSYIPSSFSVGSYNIVFYSDNPIDFSLGYDLRNDSSYDLVGGYSLRISPAWPGSTTKNIDILNPNGISVCSTSFNLASYTPDGTKNFPYPFLYFTVYLGNIYLVLPLSVGNQQFNSSFYNYKIEPFNNQNRLLGLQQAFGFNSVGFASSGTSSLSFTRSSSFELVDPLPDDDVVITINNSSVELNPDSSSDVILNPIIDSIISGTQDLNLSLDIVSEPSVEEPDIPSDITVPWLPTITTPWHYVVQLIEDSSEFIEVWIATINNVLPDFLVNSLYASIVLAITFGLIRRFLE